MMTGANWLNTCLLLNCKLYFLSVFGYNVIMIVYGASNFKRRKSKPKGIIAKKIDYAKIAKMTTNKLPSYNNVPRVGAEVALAIPSFDAGISNTEKRESIKYTGTLIKGIATMHKSNAVPVIDEEQMKDISRMRRG